MTHLKSSFASADSGLFSCMNSAFLNDMTTDKQGNGYTFEVLTPQKVYPSNIAIHNKQEILVDIEDEKTKLMKNNHIGNYITDEMETNLVGSLADVKTEYDLIDLYDNILVTPQHLNKSEKKFKESEKDCRHFMAVNSFTECNVSNANLIKNISLNETAEKDKFPSVERINAENYYCMRLNNGMESVENFESTGKINSINDGDSSTNYLNETQTDNDIDDLIDEILQMKAINHSNNNNPITSNNSGNQESSHPTLISKENTINTTNICNQPSFAKQNGMKNIQMPSKTNSQTDTMSSRSNFNCQKTEKSYDFDVVLLDTAKRDKKDLRKKIRSLVAVDGCKGNLTMGPDLFEKSVVTPQILARIAERNKKVAEKKNIQRKLLLDAGNLDNKQFNVIQVESHDIFNNFNTSKLKNTEEISLSPTVLMEDSKKVRLESLHRRSILQELVFGKK